MIGSEIIQRFRLQVDDASELSSSEEIALANEVYNDIANDRPWEWLKATGTGTTSTTLPYIALASDFKSLTPNKNDKSVIFVGADFSEYKVIPFSDRRAYRNSGGVCYIDVPNQRLVFTLQPTEAKAVEYDYIKAPTDLTVATSPLFTRKNEIISYGMAVRFTPIEQPDKAQASYMGENEDRYYSLLADLAMEDSLIKLSI